MHGIFLTDFDNLYEELTRLNVELFETTNDSDSGSEFRLGSIMWKDTNGQDHKLSEYFDPNKTVENNKNLIDTIKKAFSGSTYNIGQRAEQYNDVTSFMQKKGVIPTNTADSENWVFKNITIAGTTITRGPEGYQVYFNCPKCGQNYHCSMESKVQQLRKWKAQKSSFLPKVRLTYCDACKQAFRNRAQSNTRKQPSSEAMNLANIIIQGCPKDKDALINDNNISITFDEESSFTAFPLAETNFSIDNTWKPLTGENGKNDIGIYAIKYIDKIGAHSKYKNSIYIGKASSFFKRSRAHFYGNDGNDSDSTASMLHNLIRRIREEALLNKQNPDEAIQDNFQWRRLLTLTNNQQKYLQTAAQQNAEQLNKNMLLSALEIAAIARYHTYIRDPENNGTGLNTTPGGDGGGSITQRQLDMERLVIDELNRASNDLTSNQMAIKINTELEKMGYEPYAINTITKKIKQFKES